MANSQGMADPCCSNIDLANLQAGQRRVLAWVFGINVAAFGAMVAGSVLSGSSALLSGTLDNLGDALTYALSFAVVGASDAAKARVAVLKGLLILGAAVAVAVQIAWRLTDLHAPVVSTMSAVAAVNLAANVVCLKLLTPYRKGDVNMSSSWECSRNDVIEGGRGDRSRRCRLGVRFALAGYRRRGAVAGDLPTLGEPRPARCVAAVGTGRLAAADA